MCCPRVWNALAALRTYWHPVRPAWWARTAAASAARPWPPLQYVSIHRDPMLSGPVVTGGSPSRPRWPGHRDLRGEDRTGTPVADMPNAARAPSTKWQPTTRSPPLSMTCSALVSGAEERSLTRLRYSGAVALTSGTVASAACTSVTSLNGRRWGDGPAPTGASQLSSLGNQSPCPPIHRCYSIG